MQKTGILLINGVVALVLYLSVMYSAFADSKTCNTTIIVNKIEHALTTIEDYQFRSFVVVDGNSVTSEIKGMLPNLMRIDMTIKQADSAINMSSIFDGSHQWIETKYPSFTEVSKIELGRVTTKDRPFDTSYYLMGSGLLNGEDYPATVSTLISVYDVSAKCTKNNIELSGPLNIKNFAHYMGSKKTINSVESRVKKYSDNFGFSHLVFDNKTLALKEYSLGTKENPGFFSARYENLQLNRGLISMAFTYTPPQDVQPVDITKDLLEHIQNSD